MKKGVISLILLSLFTVCIAQEDKYPTYGLETEKTVTKAIINSKEYNDVIVEINSANHGVYFYGVLVNIKDKDGRKIYKKRFRKSNLYSSYDKSAMHIGKRNGVCFMKLYKKSDNNELEILINDRGIDGQLQ